MSGTDLAYTVIPLRALYTMSGTYLACSAVRLRARYAKPGTDIPYGATRCLVTRYGRYCIPRSSYAMSGTGVGSVIHVRCAMSGTDLGSMLSDFRFWHMEYSASVSAAMEGQVAYYPIVLAFAMGCP
eukprot:3137457-Rhodomonas_salina.1